MKIILLNHHEAIVTNDGSEAVTVSPSQDGTLTVSGKDYPISCGGESPTLAGFDKSTVTAAYTTADGIVYGVISPRIDRGVLSSRPDPYTFVLQQRLTIDELEKELETTREELRDLKGSIKYNALGFIVTGGQNS